MKAVAISRAPDRVADVVRPFAWLAAVCFSAGFWGYLAVAPLLAS